MFVLAGVGMALGVTAAARGIFWHFYSTTAEEIVPRVWLGNARMARDVSWRKSKNITHVLDVGAINEKYSDLMSDVSYKTISIEDTSSENIKQHLDDAITFVRSSLEAHENNNVLIHCYIGASRSVSIVCAYLMVTRNCTLEDALLHIQQCRPFANPNPGFKTQLLEWYQQNQDNFKTKQSTV